MSTARAISGTSALGAVLIGVAALACGRDASTPEAVSVQRTMSVREVYHRLRQCHARRSYEALRLHVDPASRDDLVAFLMAMDELFAANATALRAVHAALPDVPPEAFDLSPMGNRLELFSRDVELVRIDEQGDEADVTVQIAGRLPLSSLTFQRHQGRWVYQPGEHFAQVIPGIRRIADKLSRVAIVVASGPVTERDIRDDMHYRIEPELRRLAEASGPPADREPSPETEPRS